MIVIALAIVGIWIIGGAVVLTRTHRGSIARPFQNWQHEVSGERIRTEGEVLNTGQARGHIYGIHSRHRAVLRFYDDRNAPVTVIEQHQIFKHLEQGMRVPIAYDPRNPMGRGAIDDFSYYRNWAPFLAAGTVWIVGFLFGIVMLAIAR